MSDPPPLSTRPPPLPAAVPVLPYAGRATPTVLEYRPPVTRAVNKDAKLLLVSGMLAAVAGLAVLGGMADLLVQTWPSFGMTILAAPVGLIALAFFSVAVAAFRGMRVEQTR